MTPPLDDEELLTSGARELGLDLPASAAPRLLRYLDLLYTWNRSAGLTTIRRADAVRLHLLDSLSVVPYVRASERLADLGSGGGLPGIPIAIACPDVRVVLVEARRRKASFLAETVRELECSNCEVMYSKAEDLLEQSLDLDAVIARAFLPAIELAQLGAALVRQGGKLVVMGGRRDAELDSLGAVGGAVSVVHDVSFHLPGGDERRRILVLRRDR